MSLDFKDSEWSDCSDDEDDVAECGDYSDYSSTENCIDDAVQLKFDFIESNTCVSLNSPSNSNKMLYLLKIKRKDIASNYIQDSHGHTIAKGQPYFIGSIFEKTRDKKPHALPRI